jgi:hypothetical protein
MSRDLHIAKAPIYDPPGTRRDRVPHRLRPKPQAVDDEITALEQDNGGPLTALDRAELENL